MLQNNSFATETKEESAVDNTSSLLLWVAAGLLILSGVLMGIAFSNLLFSLLLWAGAMGCAGGALCLRRAR